mmetsp:Transcript_26902/g.82773  ORF Transcript_26902/g.82773 Transcript_26902/m.82773 type:complete len:479 (+) Transcript_26902:52-1488(+)
MLLLLLATASARGPASSASQRLPCRGLRGPARRDCVENATAAAERRGITSVASARGGWVCRAALVMKQGQGHHVSVNPKQRAAIDKKCGFDPRNPRFPARDADAGLVVAVHHNGFGNQLFQLAFAKLWAAASGADFAAALIDRREIPFEEQPKYKNGVVVPPRLPPHSDVGWRLFEQYFSNESLGRRDRLGTCAPLVPYENQYVGNGTRILGGRGADTKRIPLEKQLVGALAANDTCLKTLGYFQDYSLYAGLAGYLRKEIAPTPVDLVEGPGPDDVVIHIRKCRTAASGVHGLNKDQYYNWDNYFRHIFAGLDLRNGSVKVVTVCSEDSNFANSVLPELVQHVNATHVQPDRVRAVKMDPRHHRGNMRVIEDFTYLTRAKRLIVTESTFAWWAAFLGDADEIHAPGLGRMPVPAGEPRYVFHDMHSRQYWGRYDATRGTIVYADDATTEKIYRNWTAADLQGCPRGKFGMTGGCGTA